ncbi:MAG TPA: GAF domain-containing sensor histidine kinase, partial [Anaerolineae bacterium]|nr:GAF domain-containing sensor histidine kinase [Anaerolineae bacterium]
VVRDITARKRAEAALHRTGERLRILRDIDLDSLAARSPEETGRSALRHLRQLIPCQAGAIALIDPDTAEAIIVAYDADIILSVAEGDRLPLNARYLQPGGDRVVRYDLTSPDQLSPFLQQVRAAGLRSILVVPLVARGELLGTLGLAADRADFFTEEHASIVQEAATAIALSLHSARLFHSIAVQRDELRALTARLSELQEIERLQLARELHDRVGPNLTTLGINLNILRGQLPADLAASIGTRIDLSLELVAETIDRLRDVMADLRPPVLDDYGLRAALRWHGERFTRYTGLPVRLTGDEFAPRLPVAVELALFRIAQEALNNVARHAQATAVSLTLESAAGCARLIIADDGQGFLPGQPPADQHPRWGLLTIRERAEAVDGHVHIESTPGQGTRLTVEVKR